MSANVTSAPGYARRFYPLAGVVVYDGETDEQAFARARLERARYTWQEAQRELAAAAQARPWWEEPLPDGRT